MLGAAAGLCEGATAAAVCRASDSREQPRKAWANLDSPRRSMYLFSVHTDSITVVWPAPNTSG